MQLLYNQWKHLTELKKITCCRNAEIGCLGDLRTLNALQSPWVLNCSCNVDCSGKWTASWDVITSDNGDTEENQRKQPFHYSRASFKYHCLLWASWCADDWKAEDVSGPWGFNSSLLRQQFCELELNWYGIAILCISEPRICIRNKWNGKVK